MKNQEWYDEEYYDGGSKGSWPYIWRPEITFPLASAIKELGGLRHGDRVLDWGCARGFLVRDMRWLGIDAYGCDFSEYAIKTTDDEIKKYVRLCGGSVDIPFGGNFKLILAKDVLEHLNYETIDEVLAMFRNRSDSILIIIPLGDGESHIIKELDREQPSHITKQTLDWWADRIKRGGFYLNKVCTKWPGIKERWKNYPTGSAIIHGF